MSILSLILLFIQFTIFIIKVTFILIIPLVEYIPLYKYGKTYLATLFQSSDTIYSLIIMLIMTINLGIILISYRKSKIVYYLYNLLISIILTKIYIFNYLIKTLTEDSLKKFITQDKFWSAIIISFVLCILYYYFRMLGQKTLFFKLNYYDFDIMDW